MDFLKMKTGIIQWISKYKYVWIVLLAGVFLMMIPGKKTEDTYTQKSMQTIEDTEVTLEEKLEQILSNVAGAGKVKVMLSVAKGEQRIYQTDSTYSQDENQSDSRTQTIVITDSQRNEAGLIHQTNPPTYQGAIILAQGADDPVVKLSVVDAVSNATGLGVDKITVLKMK